jgi:hypothetical protein
MIQPASSPSNTVLGRPEQLFRMEWISLLWRTMQKTGNGYHRPTLKNQPPAGASHWRGERRADKVGTTKLTRRLALRVQVA